jgi:hypothetical protein
MRRVLVPAGVLGIALLGCTREHATTSDDASPSASAFAEPVPDEAPSIVPSTRVFPGGPPTTTASPQPPPGARVVGNSCSPGKDSIACTPDGLEVLTCASGQWRMLQSCRGPGHCAGAGSALTCDTGMPQPGDSCVPSTSETRCRNAHEAIACQGGKWMVSPCGAGTLCTPGAGKGHAGCK